MIGGQGPYMNDDGDIWVPRTVPWREARAVAAEAVTEYGFVLRYVGKTEALLLGFARECLCEEVCELADWDRDGYDPDLEDFCRVPAWYFRTELANR